MAASAAVPEPIRRAFWGGFRLGQATPLGVYSGTGAPSGDQGGAEGVQVYHRRDAASVDAALYVSVDTGTTWLPFQTSGPGGTQSDLIFDAATELTIAAGIVTATQGYHRIDTEADAASDALDSILGGTAGELLILRAESAARTVVVTHGVGANLIACPGGLSVSLAEATDWVLLAYNGTQWAVLAGSTLVGEFQPKDAELTALAGLVSAADRLPYFNGAGTATMATFTAAGRAIVDDATAADQRTTLGVGTGDSPQFAGLHVTGAVAFDGGSVLIDAEQIDLRANYLLENVDYTAAVAVTGGVVVNYLPTATATTTVGTGVVTAGVDGVSDPTITTAGAATFAAGDIVQVSGSANNGENDGLYEVVSHAANLLTLRSTAAGVTDRLEPWTQDQLVANVGDVGIALTKVGVAILRAGTDGAWEVAIGNATPFTYSDLYRVGGTDVAVADGGTAASTAADARTNLGAQTAASLAVPSLTAGVEAANAIPVTVALKDGDGSALARVQRLKCQLVAADGIVGLVGAWTLAETGAGTEVTTTARPTLYVETDAAGAAEVTVTDVSAAYVGTVYLEVTPVSVAGAAQVPGMPTMIALVFA